MNPDKLLRIQSYLDGELSRNEAQEVAAWIEKDPAVAAIHRELEATKRLLCGNEIQAQLPESREFYWSKNEREIKKEAPAASQSNSHFGSGLLRIFAPIAAAACLVALAVLSLHPPAPHRTHYVQEIETPLEEASAISFHSQAAGMTVVWIQSQEN
jgi:anti-sigma factor RsiW